jgi:hypothetical protein
MSDWQPIETAPKDGTPILGTDGARLARFHWHTYTWPRQSSIWLQHGCTAWSEEVDVHNFEGTWESFEPTHWMPLPEPPGESG